jgi:hypothetical protein
MFMRFSSRKKDLNENAVQDRDGCIVMGTSDQRNRKYFLGLLRYRDWQAAAGKGSVIL